MKRLIFLHPFKFSGTLGVCHKCWARYLAWDFAVVDESANVVTIMLHIHQHHTVLRAAHLSCMSTLQIEKGSMDICVNGRYYFRSFINLITSLSGWNYFFIRTDGLAIMIYTNTFSLDVYQRCCKYSSCWVDITEWMNNWLRKSVISLSCQTSLLKFGVYTRVKLQFIQRIVLVTNWVFTIKSFKSWYQLAIAAFLWRLCPMSYCNQNATTVKLLWMKPSHNIR